MNRDVEKPVEILLVEDNPGDIQLVQILLKTNENQSQADGGPGRRRGN